jgi:DivIVA domain-containing protein
MTAARAGPPVDRGTIPLLRKSCRHQLSVPEIVEFDFCGARVRKPCDKPHQQADAQPAGGVGGKEAPVSVADVDLFAPQEVEDIRHPRFSLVRKGYDPYEVLEYVAQVSERVEALERELHQAREERNATRRQRESAREAAYNDLADRMADLLRTAEQEAEKIRAEAADEAKQRLADAYQRAEQVEREAQKAAGRTRYEAQEAARQAREETERVLGGLASRRDTMISELRALQTGLADVVDRLQAVTTEADQAAAVSSEAPALSSVDQVVRPDSDVPSPPGEPTLDPQIGDLLTNPEGFDLVIPDLLTAEDRGPGSTENETEGQEDR